MTTLIKKSFGGSEISFNPMVTNGNVMVNATEMAKIFKKLTKDFLRNDDTKAFIVECLNKENSPYLNIKNEEDLFVSKQNSGTWMHRILALKFAAWLNPAFELWVYSTIDEILFGYSREQDESIARTIVIQQELDKMEKKADKSGEDFEEYIKLKNQLIHERTLRANGTRRRFRQIYRFLKPNINAN